MGPWLLVVASLFAAGASQAQTTNQPTLNLEGARAVLHAAEEKASSLHKPSCIAVVDAGGHLLLFERMEGAWLAGEELAAGKARSALRFGKPTAKLEEMINGGRIAGVTAAGAVEMQGGVPILVHDMIVGAVGVSGADKDGDVPIAESGSAAIAATARNDGLR